MDESTSPAGMGRTNQAVPLSHAGGFLWALLVATGGGYLCGLALTRWGEFGSMSLWALGALSGYVAHGILRAPSRSVAWALVAANALALVVAEVCWIHWKTVQGSASWWDAVRQLPAFVREYELAVLIAAVFCAFGALSAYRQTAHRYRVVAID